MMKKKHFIGLSTLLLVLLLGLFTTSYADYYEITTDDINEITGTYRVKGSGGNLDNGTGRARRMIGEAQTEFDSAGMYITTDQYGYIYGWNKDDIVSVSNYRNDNYMYITLNGSVGKRWDIYNNTTSSVSVVNLGTGAQLSTNYYIYNNDLILPNYVGPYESRNILDFNNMNFRIYPVSGTYLTACSIEGLVTPSVVYVAQKDTTATHQICWQEKFSNLQGVGVTYNRYNKATGFWDEIKDYSITDFSNYQVASDILAFTVDTFNLPADTLIGFYFTPKDQLTYDTKVFWLYFKTSYTVIENNVIKPGETFTDSYYNNYNNDTNTDKIIDNDQSDTDKIIDTLTDDSQVDNILAETFSGDIEDFAQDFGFTPLDNPFTTFLLYVVQGFYNALTGTGNVTLSANYGNYLSFVFRSQDFTTPESTLKTFLTSMLVCWYLYGNYKYFHYLISLVETAKIDKAIAELGTDEFYDTDIM